MTNPSALRLVNPLDLEDARRATRRLAELRREAERQFEEALTAAAEAERDYRKGLARAFIAVEGTATAREVEARAIAADLAYARDLSSGLSKAAQERLRGLEGERAMLRALIEWSQKLYIDGRES